MILYLPPTTLADQPAIRPSPKSSFSRFSGIREHEPCSQIVGSSTDWNAGPAV